MHKISLAGAALALAACNPLAQSDRADELIDGWHASWNAQDWNAIYRNSSAAFRAPASLEQLSANLQGMRNIYGPVEDSSQTGIGIDINNGTTNTTITRSTIFANGVGMETFVFIGSGEDLQLVSWQLEPEDQEALLGTAARRTAEEARVAGERASADEKPGASGKPAD